MQRQEVLAIVDSQPRLIEQEIERLQLMRDTDGVEDPSKLPVFKLPDSKVLTPHVVQLSSELIIRNAALKALGCDNLADETQARKNIEEAKAKFYESANVATEEAPKKVTTKASK